MTRAEERQTRLFAIERDRAQHFIVAAIAARQANRTRLVFKGGTLLRTCWKQEYRFSEDLDFDWMTHADESREDIRVLIDRALTDASSRSGMTFSWRDRAGRFAVTWTRPDGAAGVMRLDLNSRLHSTYTPATREWHVQQRYQGVPPSPPITGYSLEAVTADKLACLAEPSRAAPRDYFDLQQLLSSSEMDTERALGAFLSTHYPSTVDPPTSAQLLEVLFEPGYNHFEALDDEWKVSERKGLVPIESKDFAAIFESVHDLLEVAVHAALPSV